LDHYAFYNNLFAFVTFDPVLVTLPKSIRVPFMGSSLPIKISIDSRPYT